MYPWICPKCSRVWGPSVMACGPCNASIYTVPSTNWPPKPPPYEVTCNNFPTVLSEGRTG